MTDGKQPDYPRQQTQERGTPGRELQRQQERASGALRAVEIRKELQHNMPAARAGRRLPALPLQAASAVQGFTSAAARINRLFLWMVVLPTALAILYFAFIAAPVYVTESSFVVRTSQGQQYNSSGLGQFLAGSGILTSSSEDTYSVQEYIQSMDAMKALDAKYDLRKAFGNSHVDIFKRFGLMPGGKSDEYLLRYYQWWIVDTEIDTTSSIATLTVRAYSADDAYNINQSLLGLSEDLVNRMNQQARHDMVDFAQRDVDVAAVQAKQARLAMSAYRNTKAVLNPEQQGGIQLEQTTQLQTDLVAAKAQLAQLQSVAPDNPQIDPLKKQISTMETAINEKNLDVAGTNGSLAHKAEEFDLLAVELEYADKQLAENEALLAKAKSDALNKQLYLERISQPHKPTIAWEPRSTRDVIGTLLLSLVLWMVVTLLVSGVKEHSD
jgi:capsular polysaccharide transport system permease protein